MAGKMFVLNVGAIVVVGLGVALRAMVVAAVQLRDMRRIFFTPRIANEIGKSDGDALHW